MLTSTVFLQEDEMLRRLVAQYGTKKWAHLATIIKSKKSKQVVHTHLSCYYIPQLMLVSTATDLQCRRRWKNFQDAELKKTGVWTAAVCLSLRKHTALVFGSVVQSVQLQATLQSV